MKLGALLLFFTGANALWVQLLFFKLSTLHFGVAHRAAGITLAGFFIGLLLGAKAARRWADRLNRPFLMFALLEAWAGLYAILIMLTFSPLTDFTMNALYAVFPAPMALMGSALVVTILVLPTTFAFGASFPIAIRAVTAGARTGDTATPMLYAVNTMGASAGVMAGIYAVIPSIGYGRLAMFCGVIGVLVLMAVLIVRPKEPDQVVRSGIEESERGLSKWMILAFVSGMMTFVCETTWTHMLALVAGSSVYAFGTMLFVFLLGLAVGAQLVKLLATRHPEWSTVLHFVPLMIIGIIGIQTVGWDLAPGAFAYGELVEHSFVARELVRMAVIMLLIGPPTCMIGLLFPLILWLALKDNARIASTVAALSFWNSIGCVSGAIISTFLLIPLIGTKGTLLAINLLLVLYMVVISQRTIFYGRKRLWLAVALLAAVLPVLIPWNIQRLVSGANVYFSTGFDSPGEIVYFGEDTDAGVTVVSRKGDVLTMTTNGKFQGNDGFEMLDQRFVSLIPALLTQEYGRALNIGLGTGVSLGTLARFPFRELDVAELSGQVVKAAQVFFAEANEQVLRDRRTRIFVDDGRAVLQRAKSRTYDVISIELQSIWVRGSGNLYNREFFALCKDRLSPGGVLQQWVQLHHIQKDAIVVVLATLAEVFPDVSFWVHGHQGVVIGRNGTFLPTEQQLSERLARIREVGIRTPNDLGGTMLLSNGNIRDLLSDYAEHDPRRKWISTDLNPIIEFMTPAGVVLGNNWAENIAFLKLYRLVSRHDWMSSGSVE